MIQIINGPNLNLQGRRQPEVYGTVTMEEFYGLLQLRFPNIDIEMAQSNSEGGIIDMIHASGLNSDCTGIIINPGAYAHYSYAIADALAAVDVPAVEVHISNIHSREQFRCKSVTAASCRGMICGFGLEGYAMAVHSLLK